MADLISFFAPLDAPSLELNGPWRFAPAHNGGGHAQGYADPDFDDSSWEAVRPPHLEHSTAERDTLWYRHRFTLDPGAPFRPGLAPAERALLRLGGAFYRSHVWLNGRELGGHEGYFQPFGFDVSECLRPGENVLAVRCRFPIEAGSFKRKTAVAGVFADWDCKPYPSALYPNLPPPSEWSVPIGLWRPVTLVKTGPVLIESLNVFPRVDEPRWPPTPGAPGASACLLNVVAQLRNLTPEPRECELNLWVEPHNFEGGGSAHGRWTIPLAGLERKELRLVLNLPGPRLWFPWTHGDPCLYRARARVGAGDRAPEVGREGGEPTGGEARQVFGVRQVRAVIESNRWEWWLNGRRIFPKGSNYISDFYLDRVTDEGLARDLELARGAGLDLLRVHAHIAPPEFYRLCDERGLMVMCDFPLIWTYAFNLTPEDDAAFRASVRRQTEDMVRLLGSRPSIVLWSMHNEPPWTADGSFLGGDVHGSATNRELDEASARRVREMDPTRPAIPASGELDQHLYHGWYTGSWRDNRDLAPTFPTEFGVQALPTLDSPFWATVKSEWPVDADDPSWSHAGYQPVFWARPGVGAPSEYGSLAEYVAESQAYQAFYIRYTIDQWRRKKFAPVGGYIHFLFTDGWPAISWSVLDYFRLPKAGYAALAEASSAVRLCIDWEDGFATDRAFRPVYPEGGRLALRLFLVNDDYRLGGHVRVRWWIQRRSESAPRGWIRRLWHWMSVRSVRADLPAADAPARLIDTVRLPLTRPGEYAFRTTVTQGWRVLDENRIDFRVGAAQKKQAPTRRVPSFLINKVYRAGSLHHTPDGFAFRMRNPAMPVVLEHISKVTVDGRPVDTSRVELVLGGQTRRATMVTPQVPLELPAGEQLAVFVRGWRLPPGPHEFELTAHFLGLGEIAARIRDRLV